MALGEKTVRHTFRLPESLSRQLHALTEDPGSSRNQIVIDALSAFLDRGARSEIDERYAIRLDRMSRQLARLERRVVFVSEALGLFIQHQLTLTAHDPPFEAAAAHLGRRRYEAFLQLVWKRMSTGKHEDGVVGADERVVD
jgi:hypothetical protein